MEVGLVRQIDINTEMQQSYLDYAMSVIVARALPDARDGLKPVHRRILHAMHSMGIRPDSGFKKSARIVGEVLGKYHPHGDMAVYDAMVRMAQGFSMRYPIIEGQGNFGSMDGDPAAAMRYTEARMSDIAMEILTDLDKDTVEFLDNFDGSLKEPSVLPSAVPNMLLNGATGIAVGMATSIPPHNLIEVCDALIFLLKNWTRYENINLDDLMKFIKGPDFPTGGIIVRKGKNEGEGLGAAYGTGRGKIMVQAKAHVEEMSRGRSRIIVTELPYQTNKSSLIERIADLARSGSIDGITDLRDESDRQGMRIVIELSKNVTPEVVLRTLYRRTPMQNTFSFIMLALVEGEPRLLNLKQALRVYLEHRVEIIRRRSKFELNRARKRAHILEGLKIALKNLDDVIRLIRNAKDTPQARQRIRNRFKLTIAQADAILEMPLRRLSGLERRKIDQEFKDVQKKIKILETLLRSEKKIRDHISDELVEIKGKYGDPRRTQIVRPKSKGDQILTPLTAMDLAPSKDAWIVITNDGRISRTPTMRLPRLAGRNSPQFVIGASGRDTLYLFEERGSAAAVPIHVIPEVDQPVNGTPLNSVSPFPPNVKLTAGIAIPATNVGKGSMDHFLVFCTQMGMVKKTSLQSFPGPSAKSFTAIKVGKGDALGWVCITSGKDELLLVSRKGMAIRFSENQIRPMGLAAAGVMGMKLDAKDDLIIGMDKIIPRAELLLVSQSGLAKRTGLNQFPLQGRYGKGVLAWKSGGDVLLVGSAVGLADHRAKVNFTKSIPKSLRFGDSVRRNRASAGSPLFEITAGNLVAGLTPVFRRNKVAESRKTVATKRTPKSQSKTSGRRSKSSSSQRKTSSRKSTSPKSTASRAKGSTKTTKRSASTGTSRRKTAQPKSGTRKSSTNKPKKTTSRSSKRSTDQTK
jgi:DNA gyrase subunit A